MNEKEIYIIIEENDTDYDGYTIYTNKEKAEQEALKMNLRRKNAKVSSRVSVKKLIVKG